MSRKLSLPAVTVFVIAICTALFGACSSAPKFAPVRTLVTSDHVEILTANPCGSGVYGTEFLIQFNQLAISTPQGLRRPVAFNYRNQGRTRDEASEAVGLLGNYWPLVMYACGEFREGPNAEYRSRALAIADRAVILAVEAGLRLERATTSEEFARIIEEERARKRELYASAVEFDPF